MQGIQLQAPSCTISDACAYPWQPVVAANGDSCIGQQPATATMPVLQAMNTLKGVEQTSTSVVSGGRKRTRPSNSPPKIVSVKSEDLVKHTSPTLLSSSAAELDATDSLDWPTTGPFTYHRWHVMVERCVSQCLR